MAVTAAEGLTLALSPKGRGQRPASSRKRRLFPRGRKHDGWHASWALISRGCKGAARVDGLRPRMFARWQAKRGALTLALSRRERGQDWKVSQKERGP